MNRSTFLKTIIGSAASLALPSVSQEVSNQWVTQDAVGGVKSRFAFGGQFNFGEVTLYQHSPKEGMTKFFKDLQQNIWKTDETQRVLYRCNDFNLDAIVKYCSGQEVSILIICDGIESCEEIVKFKKIALKYPMVSVICSQRMNRQNPTDLNGCWLADNVIKFSRDSSSPIVKLNLASHRRKFEGEKEKVFIIRDNYFLDTVGFSTKKI